MILFLNVSIILKIAFAHFLNISVTDSVTTRHAEPLKMCFITVSVLHRLQSPFGMELTPVLDACTTLLPSLRCQSCWKRVEMHIWVAFSAYLAKGWFSSLEIHWTFALCKIFPFCFSSVFDAPSLEKGLLHNYRTNDSNVQAFKMIKGN